MSRFLCAIVLLHFLALVQALARIQRHVSTIDLVIPKLGITSPTKDSIHYGGESLLVVWDAQDIPENTPGQLLLGYKRPGVKNYDEHLYWALATIPNLEDGQYSFYVNNSWGTWIPKLEERSDFVVAVIGDGGFGDSSDISDQFTLKQRTTSG
ncbi:hypothetical protein BC827DRAFT_887275 [Russula dissimulans]|nr:hypothetical protein BC827DRAFT_887275 [Russula dissimulans]